MRGLFKYPQRVPNQTLGMLTRIASGMNSCLPPFALTDNLMSDLLDVEPYRDETIAFRKDTTIPKIGYDQTGLLGNVRALLPSDESTKTTDVFYLFCTGGLSWDIVREKNTGGVVTADVYTVTTTMALDLTKVFFSGTIIKTEADTYYVFGASHEKRIHYIKHAADGTNTYGYVDTPCEPKRMVTHANRVFIMDTANKLWWCRAGDIYSWYSMEFKDALIVASRNCGNAAYVLAAQPDVTRPVTATVTKTDTLDTLGILTIVGTNALDQAQTAVLTLKEGRVMTSMSFKTITSITQSGWTQGGATPDTITVGVGPVSGGYITKDAGFWTVDRESILTDMCILGNNIYIFAPHNIYVFQGYSYDTFSLQQIITDIGLAPAAYACFQSRLTVGENVAFFIYKGDIYQFDGQSSPKVISRPITVNGQVANGVYGGITMAGDAWTLAVGDGVLFAYTYDTSVPTYYVYEIEQRSWWKKSGVTPARIPSAEIIHVWYAPNYGKSAMYVFVQIWGQGFFISKTLGAIDPLLLPHVVTKAYGGAPTETGSVTEVVLMVEGEATKQADIYVKFSLTADGSDFTALAAFENFVFTGDVQMLQVYLPSSMIAAAHHYRLKFEIDPEAGTQVLMYMYERRFRAHGRSR